ncbi:MAG: hypothetical protein J2P32_05025 [Actinobacteria bacterium]|nr:hypothetical protein [Actinomycetota bacterium]
MTHTATFPRGGAGSRASGFLLMILGAWGAIVPFIGPYFSYAYTPDTTWTYTTGRLVLSILPGAAAFVGGLIILAGGASPASAAGGMLAALGGAWFVVGVPVMTIAVRDAAVSPGTPVTGGGSGISPAILRLLEGLGFFYGLGVVIVFLAAMAIGRAASRGAVAGYPATPAAPAEPEHVGPG